MQEIVDTHRSDINLIKQEIIELNNIIHKMSESKEKIQKELNFLKGENKGLKFALRLSSASPYDEDDDLE